MGGWGEGTGHHIESPSPLWTQGPLGPQLGESEDS